MKVVDCDIVVCPGCGKMHWVPIGPRAVLLCFTCKQRMIDAGEGSKSEGDSAEVVEAEQAVP